MKIVEIIFNKERRKVFLNYYEKSCGNKRKNEKKTVETKLSI